MAGRKGRSGRARLPSAIKKAHGSYRPSRAAKGEVTFPVAHLEPPEEVSGDARALREWNRVTPLLDDVKVLTQPDLVALANYCMTVSIAVRAAIEASKAPLVRKTRLGGVVNPHIKIAREARQECLRFAIEFGLTPAARSRIVGQPSKKDDAGDEAEKFLFHPPKLVVNK